MATRCDDPVLRSGRREALAVMATWIVATAYTVGYCSLRGYGRDPATLVYVFGFPDWAFWGIVAPWLVCVAVSVIFSLVIQDAELEDPSSTLPDSSAAAPAAAASENENA